MQDEQEVMSETSGDATRTRGEDGWRLETETLETKVFCNGWKASTWTSMVKVTMIGEQVKSSRRESETPGEEGEEVKSPNRKVILVESETTQDFVRKAKDTKAVFRCDNQCSEQTLSFWQFASVVIKEGEESYTTILYWKCYKASLKAKGEKPLTNWQWREFVGQKAHRGRLWK